MKADTKRFKMYTLNFWMRIVWAYKSVVCARVGVYAINRLSVPNKKIYPLLGNT